MKKLIVAAGVALVAMAAPASAAVVLTANFAPGATAIPAGLTVFQNFDSLASGSSIGTNANVFNASNGVGARPAFGSTGNFASVNSGGSAAFTFAATNAFGFTLGSLDTFNSVTFRFADGTTQTLTGAQLTNGSTANGDQSITATNGFASFTATGGSIVGATFNSAGTAFEFDNLATSAVPEPATWALMLLGFGAVGGVMRRRGDVRTRIRYA